jgi:hypothetical protein
MGLEPLVKVDDTNDSAWKWWKWMKKYRVWEANRKIFLYPENWIEPELRIDRSSFFKDLENALLQDEVNNDTVETAFLNYLEQLDGVSRLEIAGFYHEDDGDKTILHVPYTGYATTYLLLPAMGLPALVAVGKGGPRYNGRLPGAHHDQQAALSFLAGIHRSVGRE